MSSPGKYGYEFSGYATVSVRCYVEADSELEAQAMVERGDCEWLCDEVDGNVEDIELTKSDEGEE